jgi:hypothetical protein
VEKRKIRERRRRKAEDDERKGISEEETGRLEEIKRKE